MINLTSTEEFSIKGIIQEPHFSYIESTLINKKRVAFLVYHKKIDEILLVDSYGFSIDSVFAGISEKHIEYIAKNAPEDYKTNILKILADKEMMRGVFEIARSMDEDLGNDATQNQRRIRNVIQYISDNRVVFEF